MERLTGATAGGTNGGGGAPSFCSGGMETMDMDAKPPQALDIIE